MAEILLLEETTFGSVTNPPYGYSRIVSPATFVLEIGAEYRVVFDGTEYSSIGVDASPLGTGAVGIGNGAAFGLAGSGEPFCVGTFSGAMIVLCLLDTEPTQHSIAIYKKEEAASGLVTENYDGTQNVFYGVETVSLENTEGEIETFVHESLVAEPVEATVDVDWSGGDMVVTPDEGKVFSSVNIPAPENLIPQNIAEGVNIAGIIGAMVAGGGRNVVRYYGTHKGYGEIAHNLGVIPDIAIALLPHGTTFPNGKAYAAIGVSDIAYSAGIILPRNTRISSVNGKVYSSGYVVGIESTNVSHPFNNASPTTIRLGLDSSYNYEVYLIGGLT